MPVERVQLGPIPPRAILTHAHYAFLEHIIQLVKDRSIVQIALLGSIQMLVVL